MTAATRIAARAERDGCDCDTPEYFMVRPEVERILRCAHFADERLALYECFAYSAGSFRMEIPRHWHVETLSGRQDSVQFQNHYVDLAEAECAFDAAVERLLEATS